MRSRSTATTREPAGLSIGELAERTGVPAATLRSWESRYGAPRPERLAGGHRRYGEHDVVMVEEVLRQRASGLSLPSAIDRARARAEDPDVSLFAGLRRRHPGLVPHVLRKATMLALSRAIEDECCARAERPVLFASFQHPRFFDASKRRWVELARTSEAVVVFAAFTELPGLSGVRAPRTGPVPVPLPASTPLIREWAIVCDAPDYPACLAGWEHQGKESAADADRRFEAVWTVDPRAVRTAALICTHLLRASSPELGSSLAGRLAGTPPAASPDLLRAAGLLDRMMAYLEDATG
ncbi:MAG: DICT sensory domain-containing protein [Acidimicrobiales bacterium]